MTYWKIEYLEKHLKVEKENASGKKTITQGYIDHLETQLRLMKEAYEAGIAVSTGVKK